MSLVHKCTLLLCRVLQSDKLDARNDNSQGRFSPRLCCARRRVHGATYSGPITDVADPRQQSRRRVSNNKVGVKIFFMLPTSLNTSSRERHTVKVHQHEEWCCTRIFLEASGVPNSTAGTVWSPCNISQTVSHAAPGTLNALFREPSGVVSCTGKYPPVCEPFPQLAKLTTPGP